MGALNQKGDLAAAEIAFFGLSLCLALFIVFRGCFSRANGASLQLGWIFIVLLSILRIVGGATLLYIETKNDYSTGLLETTAITSAVGTAPLLLTMMTAFSRINNGMARSSFNNKSPVNRAVFHALHLAVITPALVLAIIGGEMEFSNIPGSSKAKTGRDLFEASSIVFLFFFVCLVIIALMIVRQSSLLVSTHRALLNAALVSLPFLLVRIIFIVLVAFAQPGGSFYFNNIQVWPEAFMQFTMEAVVVVCFIVAGLLTPPDPKADHSTTHGNEQHNVDQPQNRHFDEETGRRDVQRQNPEKTYSSRQPHGQQQRTQERKQKSAMEYMPSHMLYKGVKKMFNK